MPQFLLPAEGRLGERFILSGPEAFHLVRVLRYREGQAVEFFDGQGGRFSGVIRRIRPDGGVEGDITGAINGGVPPPRERVRLHLGLLKASHWEWALEKGTELGASAIVPIITPRTVVRVKETEGKLERWKRVALAAAKQCGRADLPELCVPRHFRDAMAEATKAGPTLVAWERSEGPSTFSGLREALETARAKHAPTAAPTAGAALNLFIGPEGGFSEEEIELAEMEGAAVFSLGSATLRAETAALAALAVLRYL